MLELWLGFCFLSALRAPDTVLRAPVSYLAVMFISLASRLVPPVPRPSPLRPLRAQR